MMLKVEAADGFLHLPSNSRFTLTKRGISGVKRQAVFLDRDGVLVEDVHFLDSPARLRVIAGVCSALAVLGGQFYLVVATNQSGIAREYFSEERLLEIHSELVSRLARCDVSIDAIYFCPHLPEGPPGKYSRDCDCRKPKPGMLERAALDWSIDLKRSFLIGDKVCDIEAAAAVGVQAALVGPAAGDIPGAAFAAAGISEAAARIIAMQERGVLAGR